MIEIEYLVVIDSVNYFLLTSRCFPGTFPNGRNWKNRRCFIFKVCITLYPAQSRVGRANLVFLPNFIEKLCVKWCNLTSGFLSPWSESNEIQILINNISFSRVRIEPTVAVLQSHPCAPGACRAPGAQGCTTSTKLFLK